MTAIAKYVLMRDGRALVLHSDVGAYDVLALSVAGPDLTLRYLDAFHDAFGRASGWGPDPDGWDMEAEGGLLLDVDLRTVLVFTVYTDVAQREAFFATVARTWPGWRVEWAYDGISDLMRHAGDDPLVDNPDRRADTDDLELGHRVYGRYGSPRSLCRYLVTVTAADGGVAAHSVIYPKPWWVGEQLLGALGAESRVDSCPTMPEAGLHLDLRTRDAWLWTCNRPLNGIRDEWPRLWPGWTLTFCQGHHAEQFDRCDGAVAVPLPSVSDGYDDLRKEFEAHWRMGGNDPIGRRLSLTRADIEGPLALIRPA
jgi:hypothetical protein